MRRIFSLLITVLAISCASDSNTFKINGLAEGFADGTKVFIYSVGGNNIPVSIDTLLIKNGKFEGIYDKSDVISVNYAHIDNSKSNLVYFPENEDLTFHIFKDSLAASYVIGSKLNSSYRAYSNEIRGNNALKQGYSTQFKKARQEGDNLLATEIQRENNALINAEISYRKKFISENNNSLFSVMLISEMLTKREISTVEAKSMVNALSPKVSNTKLVGDINKSITSFTAAEIGAEAPGFSAPTPDGEMLSLADTMGKYTIIDFWASWCKPCRRENPNVVRVFNKYHDKGLNIISVSLDRANQKNRWLKAIEDDNMDWYHVSNLKFWQDPIAKTYKVRSIPATFLLDENGIIIAKNLRGAALESKIASLLGD